MEPPPYPLYSTSFLLYRLSPLFLDAVNFDDNSLRQYASQFRDILVGDVLRGVRVGLAADDEPLARVGALRNVSWKHLGTEEAWRSETDGGVHRPDEPEQRHLGIFVQITYEKVTYSAILLWDREKEDEASFAHYPLILTRMPTTLRQTFLHFLSRTFDTRASLMKLPSQFLTEILEKYLSDLTTSGNGPDPSTQESTESIIKDILITVSFEIPGGSSSLKTIDITIPKDDVWPMIVRGRKLQQINQSAANSTNSDRPFTMALSHYIRGHLGLNLEHNYVNFSKISCGAFVIGMEGRVKIFPPRGGDDIQERATKTLLESLVRAAQSRYR